MRRGKKEVMKIVYSQKDEIKRSKRFSRDAFGSLPPTKVEKAKKGGDYSRKKKHPDKDEDD